MVNILNNATSLINRYERHVVFAHLPYDAMALYPLIMVRGSRYLDDQVLLNHERIHHRQQRELLILPFYLIYILNYLVNRIRYRSHEKAYREIVFEREAYAHEQDLMYLSRRRRWACFTCKYTGL